MAEGDAEVKKKGWKVDVLTFVAMVMWLGGFQINFVVVGLCFWNWSKPWALTLLAFWIGLLFVPVRYNNGGAGDSVAKFICKYVPAYFPIKVVFEDESAFKPKQSYVFAAEPHSILPLGLIILTPQCGVLPVSDLRGLGTSAIFWTPYVRQVWTWLGLVPVSRKYFTELLQRGTSTVVIPGGVQECLYLERGREVVFLRKRFGFIKVAMETGAHIVPTFCFGQSNTYRWWKPKGQWYNQLSRAIGFTPLVFWGRYGTPIPFRSPMTYVIGKPIEVVKNPQATHEEVGAVLEKYIEAVEKLFESHKAAAGFKDTPLHVY